MEERAGAKKGEVISGCKVARDVLSMRGRHAYTAFVFFCFSVLRA